MNKREFLKELKAKLKNLPKEEKEDAIRYYEEYFEEAQIEDDVDVLYKLESPSQVASQILSEYAVKGFNEEPKSIKRGISSMWFILLALLISPLAFPIVLPVLIGVFVVGLLTLIFAFIFGVVSISLIWAGFSVFFSGFKYLFSNFAMAITSIGVGCIMIGLTALGVIGIVLLLNKVFKYSVIFMNNILNKVK